ncbi:MAG: hypothetical protein JWP79_3043 [Polaromonas sp.]|jgi:hypothetical protein|nr:hypothetical protein [Polaromonas sp.]MDB5940173.1 hypothetical protein [Polaromonas sp.]
MNKPLSEPVAPSDAAPLVQADVLGEATPLKPPVAPAEQAGERTAQATKDSDPQPAQDENQPGFIGERNLPHP